MGSSDTRRQLGGGISRPRSSFSRNSPEPLRRAVADSLSSTSSSPIGSPSIVASEASRTLGDYIAASTTTDLAYRIILEHTQSEKARSPAVVARCIAHLKRYLLRYKPSEEMLRQIDRFCFSIISECKGSASRRLSPWGQPLDQQSGGYSPSTSSSMPPIYSFASESLVRSLNYIRSLVAQHIPKQTLQRVKPGDPSGLPTLSSLLNKSFKSQSSAAHGAYLRREDALALQISNPSSIEKVDGKDDVVCVIGDVLRWRWHGTQKISLHFPNCKGGSNARHLYHHGLLEVGAAALLVGDVETNMNSQSKNNFGNASFTNIGEILKPHSVTAVKSSSTLPHLRAITACKRNKQGSHKIWEDSVVNTFHPHAKQLFQYRYYSEQLPLRLNNAEVHEVIASVCSEKASESVKISLSKGKGKPSVDIAVSVLVKLIIDMYVQDSGASTLLTFSMLQEMVTSSRPTTRVRAFDIVINLGVHAQLLEHIMADDTSLIEEDFFHRTSFEQYDSQLRDTERVKMYAYLATDKFELWILGILCELLLLLVQGEENEESVWASALSSLLYFACDRGTIRISRLNGLDIRVVKMLLEVSRRNSWADIVHSKLISVLVSLLYQVDEETHVPKFLLEQVEAIGGIDFVISEYSLSNSREDRRNLYLALFDYILHKKNGPCLNSGDYDDDEMQFLPYILTLEDRAEVVYIYVKLGLEGIGQFLRYSISERLDGCSDNVRVNKLLEEIASKLDFTVHLFTHLDKEFKPKMDITKTCRFLKCIDDLNPEQSAAIEVRLAWSTLHSLLHSENISCRRNAYAWLVDLLMSEIVEVSRSTKSNITKLQQQITVIGIQDFADYSDISLSVSLLCGLLKSNDNIIRCGFLFVLERLLMRCKFLFDENRVNRVQIGMRSESICFESGESHLEKANGIIDIMSCSLSLLAQINETDHLIILKMCDILFSQLCLKVPPGSEVLWEDTIFTSNLQFERDDSASVFEEYNKSIGQRFNFSGESNVTYSASSMAVLLLHGHAIVPVQLVSRVPAALFYWPLIQLASAATDNISLGFSVGSKGRGNVPGATSDIRAALLLLLIVKCTEDHTAYQEVGGEVFFRELLHDMDSRVAYYSSIFLLKQMITEEPEKYKHMLQSLVFRAQQTNNEKILENPYLQMRGILQLSNDLGTPL